MSTKLSENPDEVECAPGSIDRPGKPCVKIPKQAPGEDDATATAHVMRAYQDVYACKDDLASSRPSCSSDILKVASLDVEAKDANPGFVSCDNYLNLPDWPDQDGGAAMLSNIPDDLADRITKEIEWYNAIVVKLTDALDKGNNPPSSPPDSKDTPIADSSGKAWSADGTGKQVKSTLKEGFFDAAKCSPSAQQARLERERRAKLQSKPAEPSKPDPADDPDSCVMPDLASEIARVNSLLDSPTMTKAVGQAGSLLGAMKQLQISQQKAKDGTLYAWQQDGPKKSYTAFKGGDRISGLLFSMKQNQ